MEKLPASFFRHAYVGASARWVGALRERVVKADVPDSSDGGGRTAYHLTCAIAEAPFFLGTLIMATLAASAIGAASGASAFLATLWALLICAGAAAVLYLCQFGKGWRRIVVGLPEPEARLYALSAVIGTGLVWALGIVVCGSVSSESALALAPLSGAVAAVGALSLIAMPLASRIFLLLILSGNALVLFLHGAMATFGAGLALALLGAGLWRLGAKLAPQMIAVAKAQDRSGLLQATIERVRLGVLAVDSNQRIVAANSAAASILRVDVALLQPGAAFSLVEPHLPGFRLHGGADPISGGAGVEARRPGEFFTPQGRQIELRATPCADGVHVIVLEDVTTRRMREMQQQRHVVALDCILRGKSIQETVTALASTAWDEIRGFCFGVLLLEQETRRLRLVVSVGLPEDFKRAHLDMELRHAPALVRDAIERHIVGLAPDLATDSNFSIVEKAELKPAGFAACWTVPILSKSNVALGAVIAFRSHLGGPGQDEMELAKALARSIANAHGWEAMLRERVEREDGKLARNAKQRFLANMSHELRTPLNAIIGFAESMKAGIFGPLGNEKYAEYARDIHGSGNQLNEAIDSVLEYARIESDSYVLDEQTIDLIAIVEAGIDAARKASNAARIEHTARSASLPLLRADRFAVTETLRRLIANAMKYSPPGSTVSITTGISESKEIWLQIKDYGLGIAPELVGRVLRPFSMLADPQARDQGKGALGLGLPLAKAYVELHGGRFVLDSALGQGTEATIVFPAARSVFDPPAG